MSHTSHWDLQRIFTVALSVSLEFEEGEVTQFSLSRVEDIEAGRLWVAMPIRAAMFVPLPVDTPVMVHLKRDDAIYTLHTTVVGRRLQPTPMLQLAPTSTILRRQQRDYVRLRIVLIPSYAAVVDEEDVETRLAATIVNLSAGGLLLRTRQELKIGQLVRFSVDLPAPGGAISASARALRTDTRRAERGVYHDTACTFIDLSEHDRDLITKFIFRFQVRQRQETGALS